MQIQTLRGSNNMFNNINSNRGGNNKSIGSNNNSISSNNNNNNDTKYGLINDLQGRNVFIEEYCQVGLFGLMFTSFDPTRNVRIPAQITRIDVKNSGPGNRGRSCRPQVWDLKDQPHLRGQRDSFVARQGQDLVVVPA